jgi:hypothetical protein
MDRTKWLAGRITVAALLLLGFIAGASAAEPLFKDVLSVNHLDQTFSEALSVDITSPGTYLVDLRHDGGPNVFESLSLEVFSGSNTSGAPLGSIIGDGTFSFTADKAGIYTALAFGEKLKLHGGGTLAISVTAVPEPETWLLMLVGLGFIAFKSLRGRQAFGDRSPIA